MATTTKSTKTRSATARQESEAPEASRKSASRNGDRTIPPASFLTLGIDEALANMAQDGKSTNAVAALRDQWSLYSRLEVQRLIRKAATANNVDTGESEAKRGEQFVDIVREALTTLDGTVVDPRLTFLVRTGWHEGMDLTKRTQYPRGPGRGFLQMEFKAAFDAIEYAEKKRWVGFLASAATVTSKALTDAAKPLANASRWPDGNLIASLLQEYDLFAVLMARSYLARFAEAIPESFDDQADYWEKQWHRQTAPTKKAKWLSDAKRLNKHLGWG